MTWLSKFSGLPTLFQVPDPTDTYAAGVFTIDTLTSAVNRDWNNTGGNTNAPRAYVDLNTILADHLTAVLRVTGRCSAIGIVAEQNIRRGVALYGPNADDACLSFIVEADPAVSPGVGSAYGRAEENGTTNDLGPDALTSCGAPNQFRLYWNGNDAAFVIPDSGFGSYSVPANTCSYWYSEDDGTTWVRVGDRAIDPGVEPTYAAIWAGADAVAGESLTVTFTTLDVDEYNLDPEIRNKNPDDGEKYHDVAQNLYLEIVDRNDNLDASTVEIWLQGDLVWTGDAQQSGFVVTKTAIDLGFSYEINPDSDLDDGREYSARAYAEDTEGLSVDETWFFTAGDLHIGSDEYQSRNVPVRSEVSAEGDDEVVFPVMGPITTPTAMIGAGVDVPGPVDHAATALNQNRQGPESEVSVEKDDYSLPYGAGGPESHLLKAHQTTPVLGGGATIYGSPDRQPGVDVDSDHQDQASFHDELTFPSGGGNKIPHNFPHEPRGVVLWQRDEKSEPQQDESTFHDGMFYFVGDAHDYIQEKLDGDGNPFLIDADIRSILFFDTTGDAWHTPTGGFYGADRTGSFRYDGTLCGPAEFGTLAAGVYRWAWDDGYTQPYALTNCPRAPSMVADGKARFTGVLTAEQGFLASDGRWHFIDDFDVEFKFENLSFVGGSDGFVDLEVGHDSSNYGYIRREMSGVYGADVMNNGSWHGYVSAATGDTAGRFRATKVGSTLTLYYWGGASWVSLKSVSMTHGDKRFWFRVKVRSESGTDVTVDVFDFVINSGNATNKTGWAYESSGAYRGTRPDFPERGLIVVTEGAVTIIDTDNDKMWMRFINGSNNIVHLFGTYRRPMDVRFKNGILLIAHGYPSTTGDEGGLIRVDFRLDEARIHRQSGSTITGGFYDCITNAGNSRGRHCGQGSIEARNSDFGYFGDFDDWQIPAYSVNGCALWSSGGYEYRAAATEAGLAIFRWRENYLNHGGGAGEDDDDPDRATWIETDFCYWCTIRESDGELFWVANDGTGAKLHSLSKTGYETPMDGGLFPAASSKTLPGTRNTGATNGWPQYKPAFLSSTVYVPSNEGVWSVNWPGGSWVRLFGPPGSGATYESLPSTTTRVTSVMVVKDGTIDLICIGVELGERSQVQIFRLDTGALYAKTKVVGAKTTAALAAA